MQLGAVRDDGAAPSIDDCRSRADSATGPCYIELRLVEADEGALEGDGVYTAWLRDGDRAADPPDGGQCIECVLNLGRGGGGGEGRCCLSIEGECKGTGRRTTERDLLHLRYPGPSQGLAVVQAQNTLV